MRMEVNPVSHIPGTVPEGEAPPCPRIVVDTETVGYRAGIVVDTIPRRIVPAGAVYDRRPVHIAAGIAWEVADIHHARGGVVHVHVLRVVGR